MKATLATRVIGALLVLAGLATAAQSAEAPQPAAAREATERSVIQVPRAAIYPGDRITDEIIVEKDYKGASDYVSAVFSSREGLIGGVARRTLLPGQPIPRDSVRTPHVIRLGQQVSIGLEAPAIVMSASGVALQAGGVGDTISVRNVESGRVIKGLVLGDGSVKVTGP